MIIRFSNDLKKEEVYAQGAELASIMGLDRKNGKRVLSYPLSKRLRVYTFSNPVLVTDSYRISLLKPTLRDTLFSLFSSGLRTVEYGGTSIVCNNSYLGVWSPSIDTLVFAMGMRKFFLGAKNLRGFRDAIEIGCGSGFLGKYLLMKSMGIRSLLINDINLYAIKCARDNIQDKRAFFGVGNGLSWMRKEIKRRKRKFDLIISNPPYVPRPRSIDDNPYEGIHLLYHLVHEGQKYLNDGGVLITNVSSLAWDIVFRRKPKMGMRVLARAKVPLKVNNILNSPTWLSYLKKRGLRKKMSRGYEYWHTINILAFENEK